ncbi:MAG: hypothetical protein EB018_05905 [Gammaproteobacteria bacterium]|nr:hypothetical protein [Gammaproteobacteria bacterium]
MATAGTQSIGEYAARGAGTDDDEVEVEGVVRGHDLQPSRLRVMILATRWSYFRVETAMDVST